MPRDPTQIIEWYCSQATYWQFQELVEMLSELSEDSDQFRDVVDQIKSLPNFPVGYDEENAHIYPIPTTVRVN